MTRFIVKNESTKKICATIRLDHLLSIHLTTLNAIVNTLGKAYVIV